LRTGFGPPRKAAIMSMERDRFDGPRVLLINDDSDELNAFSMGLRLEGICITGTTSATRALDLLALADYDIALIDLMISEINGLELARKIRNKHPRVLTILMSDYLLSPVQLAKANTGVIGFVPKPCRFEEVARFIRAKLESRVQKEEISAARAASRVNSQEPFDVLSVQFAW
jgi:DNA-binding NtrC family response regulator